MSDARRTYRTGWQIFRWPLLFTVLSLIGLVAALVGDGIWDALSWLSLAAVVLVMLPVTGRFALRRRGS